MQYMTIKDLKEALHIGNDRAYQLVQLRGFPSFRLGERGQWLIDPDGLKKWIEKVERLPEKGADLLRR